MKRVIVRIEEHLVKEFEVDVNTDDADEAMELAESFILTKYDSGEIKLTKEDDYSGTTLYNTECDGIDTSWNDYYGSSMQRKPVPENMCTIVN